MVFCLMAALGHFLSFHIEVQRLSIIYPDSTKSFFLKAEKEFLSCSCYSVLVGIQFFMPFELNENFEFLNLQIVLTLNNLKWQEPNPQRIANFKPFLASNNEGTILIFS